MSVRKVLAGLLLIGLLASCGQNTPTERAAGVTNHQAVEWIANLRPDILKATYEKYELSVANSPLTQAQREEVLKGFLREAVEGGGLQEVEPQYDLLAVYNNMTDAEKQLCLNIIKVCSNSCCRH